MYDGGRCGAETEGQSEADCVFGVQRAVELSRELSDAENSGARDLRIWPINSVTGFGVFESQLDNEGKRRFWSSY
eukprot:scaffold1160_cov261-Pinguiococcus_pyrenoidosus.AAC.7